MKKVFISSRSRDSKTIGLKLIRRQKRITSNQHTTYVSFVTQNYRYFGHAR